MNKTDRLSLRNKATLPTSNPDEQAAEGEK